VGFEARENKTGFVLCVCKTGREGALSPPEPVLFLFRWFQDLERAQQTLVDAHHCACVVEFAAVVRCAEKGNKLSLRKELVSVLYDLMCAADKVHVVLL